MIEGPHTFDLDHFSAHPGEQVGAIWACNDA